MCLVHVLLSLKGGTIPLVLVLLPLYRGGGRGQRRPLRLSSRQRRESAIIAYIPLYPHALRHTSPLEVCFFLVSWRSRCH